jgi:hypothetical protein
VAEAPPPRAAEAVREAAQPVVIPIRLPRDTHCEIVLRIVLEGDEKAA